MAAFQALNGIPATANRWLLDDILRSEMKFQGTVISDWGAVMELIRHGVAENDIEAGEEALRAGIQIEMATTTIMKNIDEYVNLDPNIEILLIEPLKVSFIKRRAWFIRGSISWGKRTA